ncbi:MAG TPA: Gfo/Idh/MocA family oxidoreductase [Chloroflexota bacterium]|nr:Gfo/Idh/MocA family oxidoreductase [Chloroflexota bacterium]
MTTNAQPAEPQAKPRYRAALVGCSRMGAFIDNEVVGRSSIVLPYSHAAGYEACARTDLVAGADLRPDVLAAFGQRYGVPAEHLYTDYRRLIVDERPDILSIATQPEQRAEVALFAAEHGVRALYCEKPLCASMAEADALRAAIEGRGVVFNMGTNRRWHPGFDVMRELIASEALGQLRTLIIYSTGALFNTATHWFDAIQRLNGDTPASWVQGFLPQGQVVLDGTTIVEDPAGQGTIAFANGVMAHALLSPRNNDIEAICERGTITARAGGSDFELHRLSSEDGEARHVPAPFPAFTRASTTLRLVEDLVQALDTGTPTRGGIGVAWANAELIFALIESHRRGGARVPLPLGQNPLALARSGFRPRRPKVEPPA